jgi:hypothetical protein
VLRAKFGHSIACDSMKGQSSFEIVFTLERVMKDFKVFVGFSRVFIDLWHVQGSWQCTCAQRDRRSA